MREGYSWPVEAHESFWIATTPSRSYPVLDRDLEVDVLVVGGGIVGVTTALLVAKGGRRVALVESKGAHDAKRLIGDRLVGDEPAETVVELEPGEGEIVRVEGERLAPTPRAPCAP